MRKVATRLVLAPAYWYIWQHMGGSSGSSGSSGGSGGNRTAIQRLVAGAGGLRRAVNQLSAGAANRIGVRLDATTAAFAGASPRLATAIATGKADARGNTTLGGQIAKGNRLPPISVTVTGSGKSTKMSIGDGRHRLYAARQAGATHIRARVTRYGKDKLGRTRGAQGRRNDAQDIIESV